MIDKLCLTLNIPPKSYLIMSKVVLSLFPPPSLTAIPDYLCRALCPLPGRKRRRSRGRRGGIAVKLKLFLSSSKSGSLFGVGLHAYGARFNRFLVRRHWSQHTCGFYRLCQIGQINLHCFAHLVSAGAECVPATFVRCTGHHSRPWIRCRLGWL